MREGHSSADGGGDNRFAAHSRFVEHVTVFNIPLVAHIVADFHQHIFSTSALKFMEHQFGGGKAFNAAFNGVAPAAAAGAAGKRHIGRVKNAGAVWTAAEFSFASANTVDERLGQRITAAGAVFTGNRGERLHVFIHQPHKPGAQFGRELAGE